MLVLVVAKKVRAGLRIWVELALRRGFAIAGAKRPLRLPVRSQIDDWGTSIRP